MTVSSSEESIFGSIGGGAGEAECWTFGPRAGVGHCQDVPRTEDVGI